MIKHQQPILTIGFPYWLVASTIWNLLKKISLVPSKGLTFGGFHVLKPPQSTPKEAHSGISGKDVSDSTIARGINFVLFFPCFCSKNYKSTINPKNRWHKQSFWIKTFLHQHTEKIKQPNNPKKTQQTDTKNGTKQLIPNKKTRPTHPLHQPKWRLRQLPTRCFQGCLV